jgi:hypothetical protein
MTIPSQYDTVHLVGRETVSLPVINSGINASYFVKFIQGLGAPEFEVVLSKNQDARTAFEARHTQGRELIFRVILNPDFTEGERVRLLRAPFYGLITPEWSDQGPLVEVIFSHEGTDQFWTRGYVKTLELAPFNKEPELQLTILCSDPYLHALSTYSASGLSSTSPITVENVGSAPTGFLAKFAVDASMTEFNLRSGAAGWGPELYLQSGAQTFLAGDEIHINTDPPDRFVGHMRGGSYLQTYQLVTAGTTGWPTLEGGNNTLSWDMSAGNFSWISLQYEPKYWGI